MKIATHIYTPIGEVYVWEDHPTEAASKRAHERESVRRMLDQIGIDSSALSRRNSGQPVLNEGNGPHISISHSSFRFTVYISEIPAGVDIQCFKPRIAQGRDYFMNREELHWTSMEDLHLIWAGKESLYKLLGGNLHDPAAEISVVEINRAEKKMTMCYGNSFFHGEFREEKEYCLVYTV